MTNLFHFSFLPIVKYIYTFSKMFSSPRLQKCQHKNDRRVYSSIDNLMTTYNTHLWCIGWKKVSKVRVTVWRKGLYYFELDATS